MWESDSCWLFIDVVTILGATVASRNDVVVNLLGSEKWHLSPV
jgi:hypothetical protein